MVDFNKDSPSDKDIEELKLFLQGLFGSKVTEKVARVWWKHIHDSQVGDKN